MDARRRLLLRARIVAWLTPTVIVLVGCAMPAAGNQNREATTTTKGREGPSACSIDASNEDYEKEINRINEIIDGIDSGRINKSYTPTAAYMVIGCLSSREDHKRLDKVSDAAKRHISEAPDGDYGKYASSVYHWIAESKLKRGNLNGYVQTLEEGAKAARARGAKGVALRLETHLIAGLTSAEKPDRAIRVSKETEKLIADSDLLRSKDWEEFGYYFYMNTASAYGRAKDYITSITWGQRALKEAERKIESGIFTERSRENRNSQMLSIASTYGFLEKPSEGLEMLESLEQKLGGKCEEKLGEGGISNSHKSWCTSMKAWLYSMRANKSWGTENAKAIRDYRLSLKYTDDKPKNRYYALTSLANALYESQVPDQIKEALGLNEQALEIISKEEGSSSKDYIRTSLSLAFCLNELDRYDEAVNVINKSITIAKESFGNDKDLLTELQGGLATVNYNKNGVTSDSAEYASRELDLAKRERQRKGEPDLYLSDRLLMMSAVRLDEGKFVDAIRLAKESIKEKTLVLRGRLGALATDNREEFTGYALGDLEAIYSYAHLIPEAAELAFFARLNLHGLIEEVARQQSQALQRLSRSDDTLIKKIEAINRDLAELGGGNERKIELQEQKKELEKVLYSRIGLEQPFYIEKEQVSRALNQGEALVEIKKYRKWDRSMPRSRRWGGYGYQMYIVNSEGQLFFKNIGNAEEIESSISRALISSQPDAKDGSLSNATKSIESWKSIIDLIADKLTGYQKIYLSPDGEMHKVPWNAFGSLQKNSILKGLERIDIITTGRDLVSSKGPDALTTSPVVVANPAFNLRPLVANTDQDSAKSSQRSGQLTNGSWAELPYTKKEGEQIAKMINGNLIMGQQASTAKIKSVKSPSTLHIATHGFFFNPRSEENPMIASGLVFAGANKMQVNSGEDAYLTSLEVSSMNLQGTNLVVLSACSTGDGIIKNGEGVYGLRRALKVAGAKHSLLSLWKVDDAATAAFMSQFYERISAGDSPSVALTKTQKQFLESPIAAWRHPYYWAAWQLVSSQKERR